MKLVVCASCCDSSRLGHHEHTCSSLPSVLCCRSCRFDSSFSLPPLPLTLSVSLSLSPACPLPLCLSGLPISLNLLFAIISLSAFSECVHALCVCVCLFACAYVCVCQPTAKFGNYIDLNPRLAIPSLFKECAAWPQTWPRTSRSCSTSGPCALT